MGLDVLGHDLVRPLFVCPDSRAALLGFGHLVQELFPAYAGVEASVPRLPVPLDVAALRAVSTVVVELLEVGEVNTHLSKLRRADLVGRGARRGGWLIEPRPLSWLLIGSRERPDSRQLLAVPAVRLGPPSY